jgi:hypothetical protein
MNSFDLRGTMFGASRRFRREADAPTRSLTTEQMASPAPETWELEVDSFAPSWLELLVLEINGLARLPVGWDSYGAARLERKAAEFAIMLLGHMRFGGPAPWVSPTSDGGLHLEWGRGGFGVEVEVSKDGDVEVLVDDNGAMTEWRSTVFGDAELSAALERVGNFT